MIKKFLFVLVFLLLINTVIAADIAYVLKDDRYPNNEVISSIDDLGYTYDLIDDGDIDTTNFDDYEMIVVWDEFLSQYYNLPITNKKSLVANLHYLDDWKIANTIASRTSTGLEYGYIMEDNTITEGLTEPIQLYSETQIQLYHLPLSFQVAPGLEEVVSIESGIYYQPVIGTLVEGDALYGGGVANARTLVFTIVDSDYWTSGTEQLFKNSITWVMEGEDNDEDGFFEGQDCDDEDPEINPDAVEIPYDGIDQDCSGSDLTDVDEDGYDAVVAGGSDCDDNDILIWQDVELYVDADGDDYGAGDSVTLCIGDSTPEGYSENNEDCDDSDAEVNPDSSDVYKNCVNDAPIVEDVAKIIVNEGEIVEIVVSAVDPEDDTMNYFIDDGRFSNIDNVFTWTTGYNDNGVYIFNINVDDGELEDDIDVELEVLDLNQAPSCVGTILLEWNEDTIGAFNLKNYCSDPDEDEITFTLNDTSEDDYISLNSDPTSGYLSFSSEENWYGDDWVVFLVSDGEFEILTEQIVLRVNPVNDAPVLDMQIDDIVWGEDTNLEDYLNLDDYFSDIDGDELTYEVSGNTLIDVIIDVVFASFMPSLDWYGSESVIFTASDGEYDVDSNSVLLTVENTEEPPEFGVQVCEIDILEDEEYTCELVASDFEAEEFEFSVIDNDNLQCVIEENILTYISDEDYFGPASCLLRVSGDDGDDDYLFTVIIENVNDAPVIDEYDPETNPNILKDTEKEFSISASDIDDDVITITWFLDDVEVDTGLDYLFNQSQGEYNLTVVVSDGESEETNQQWDVFVGLIDDLTCEEVSGFVCTQYQACSVDYLGVYDTSVCCPVACSAKPPEFSDIDDREDISDNIDVRIEDLDKDEYLLGEDIRFKVEVENNGDEDIEPDVNAYLYDLTEDEIIEENENILDVPESRTRFLYFEFPLLKELDEDHQYAIFVKAYADEDEEYYDEDWETLDLERDERDIIIDSIEVDNEFICGDAFELKVNVRNLGSDDEKMHILVLNSGLKISEESEELEIERYDEDDEVSKTFDLKIPETAKGTYSLRVSVSYDDESVSSNKQIKVECNDEHVELETIDTIKIENQNSNAVEKGNIIIDNKLIIFIIMGALILLLIVVVLLMMFL